MEKMAKTHFFNPVTEKYEFNGWADAIGVRATSKTEVPEKGQWQVLNPKGPCAHIVYTLAPMYLYRDYFKANVYTIRVHGPLGEQ